MTKDIDLCGLGNGLVDLQFQVNDSELEFLELKKGEMTLAAPDKQAKVLEHLSKGEKNLCSGGSAANTIIAFSQLGGKAAYKTLLGKDEYGTFYSKEFTDLGIEIIANQIDTPTGTCIVLITPDSERTMQTCLGASGLYGKAEINADIIKRSKYLYVEGYELSQDTSAEAVFNSIDIAKANDTKIAVTFSDLFIVDIFGDNLRKVVEQADLVFCNENEALAYTKEDTVEAAYEKLKTIVPNVVITLGPKGSLVHFDNTTYNIPPYDAKPIDTTGAGDMFAGGFLYGIVVENDANFAGHLGSLTSAKIVSQLGARYDGDLAVLKNEISK